MAGYDFVGTFTVYKVNPGVFRFASFYCKSVSGSSVYMPKDAIVFNTQTGQVYKCTKTGTQSIGNKSGTGFNLPEYSFVRVDVAVKPDAKPTGVAAPTKDNALVMTAKWPAQKVDGNNCKRFTSLVALFTIKDNVRTYTTRSVTLAVGATSTTIDLANFVDPSGYQYLNHWYPIGSRKLSSVTVNLKGWNAYGAGPAALATYSFGVPRMPTVKWSFDAARGEVKATIETNAGTDARHRHDTRIDIDVRGTDGKWTPWKSEAVTATSQSYTYDATGYQGMAYSQNLCLRVRAWARGVAGDSEVRESFYYVSYPTQATIKKAVVSGRSSTDKATLTIATNTKKENPVGQVKLEYLADVPYKTAASIPGSAEWVDSGIVDDAQCTALSMGVADLMPSPGNATWMRVKTWRLNEAVLYRYSAPVRLTGLETPAPTAADEVIKVLTTTPAADGTSIDVALGWNASGTDDADGSELSWSADVAAWRSVSGPSSFEFDWDNGARTHQGTTYRSSAVVRVDGLEPNTIYNFRARRFMELDGGKRSWSPYSNIATGATRSDPGTLSVSAASTVARRSGLDVSWEFSGEGLQKSWQITIPGNGGTIANGTGTRTAYKLSWARISSKVPSSGVLTYVVRVQTEFGWVESDPMQVTVIEPPTLSLTVPATLNTQPLSFTAACSRTCDLLVSVKANGVDGEGPAGPERQPEGDVLWSGIRNGPYSNGTKTVTMPSGLAFVDGASYTLEVTAVETNGLDSGVVSKRFEVDWTSKAKLPSAEVEPVDEVDDETGEHVMGARITLKKPTGAATTDRYDLYRLDNGRACLIGEGLGLTDTVLDKYAPFGAAIPLYYRAALRTKHGDVAWSDFLYYLGGSCIRFDWEGGSVELPYNLDVSDAWAKGVELRTHMDGSSDAYYNGSVQRKAQLASGIYKVEQGETLDAIKALARHTGPVFVRTPDGAAFAANVDVTDLSSADDLLATVAFDATEIDLVEAFMLEGQR